MYSKPAGRRDVGDGGRLPVSRRDRDVLIGPEYLDRVAGLDAPRTASSDGRADSLRTGNGQFGCVFRERRIPLHIAAAPFSLSFKCDGVVDSNAFAYLNRVWKCAFDNEFGVVPPRLIIDRRIATARKHDRPLPAVPRAVYRG